MAIRCLLRSLKWFATLQAILLLLTLFWVESVPNAAPPDYAGLRLPLHLLTIYLVAGHYVILNNDMSQKDITYLRVAGRWLIALVVLTVLVDILYASLILVPTYVAEQARHSTNNSIVDHMRFIGTLCLTIITFFGALAITYLLIRCQRIVNDNIISSKMHTNHQVLPSSPPIKSSTPTRTLLLAVPPTTPPLSLPIVTNAIDCKKDMSNVGRRYI